jgi:hypothetical protein
MPKTLRTSSARDLSAGFCGRGKINKDDVIGELWGNKEALARDIRLMQLYWKFMTSV